MLQRKEARLFKNDEEKCGVTIIQDTLNPILNEYFFSLEMICEAIAYDECPDPYFLGSLFDAFEKNKDCIYMNKQSRHPNEILNEQHYLMRKFNFQNFWNRKQGKLFIQLSVLLTNLGSLRCVSKIFSHCIDLRLLPYRLNRYRMVKLMVQLKEPELESWNGIEINSKSNILMIAKKVIEENDSRDSKYLKMYANQFFIMQSVNCSDCTFCKNNCELYLSTINLMKQLQKIFCTTKVN